MQKQVSCLMQWEWGRIIFSYKLKKKIQLHISIMQETEKIKCKNKYIKKLNYGGQNFMARKLSIHLPYGQIYFMTKQHTNRH